MEDERLYYCVIDDDYNVVVDVLTQNPMRRHL